MPHCFNSKKERGEKKKEEWEEGWKRRRRQTNERGEKNRCSGFNCSSVWTNARPECSGIFGIVSLPSSSSFSLSESRCSRRRRWRRRGGRRRRGGGDWKKREREKRVHLGSMKTFTSRRGGTWAKAAFTTHSFMPCAYAWHAVRAGSKLHSHAHRPWNGVRGAATRQPVRRCRWCCAQGSVPWTPLTSTFLETTCRPMRNPPGLMIILTIPTTSIVVYALLSARNWLDLCSSFVSFFWGGRREKRSFFSSIVFQSLSRFVESKIRTGR